MRIRYITGRCGELEKGLSLHLSEQAVDYQGLAINSSFLAQSLAYQTDLVRQHALSAEEGYLIATSYGAYLLMLSLIDAPIVPDRVLLISPVLGTAIVPTQMSSFRPPQANRLKVAIAEGVTEFWPFSSSAVHGYDHTDRHLLANLYKFYGSHIHSRFQARTA